VENAKTISIVANGTNIIWSATKDIAYAANIGPIWTVIRLMDVSVFSILQA